MIWTTSSQIHWLTAQKGSVDVYSVISVIFSSILFWQFWTFWRSRHRFEKDRTVWNRYNDILLNWRSTGRLFWKFLSTCWLHHSCEEISGSSSAVSLREWRDLLQALSPLSINSEPRWLTQSWWFQTFKIKFNFFYKILKFDIIWLYVNQLWQSYKPIR